MSSLSYYCFYVFACFVVIREAYRALTPPRNFPPDLPLVPFWVLMISWFTDWDQEKVFNRYLRAKLEEHGAVLIYFGSRWNILVTRPDLLAQMLKNNSTFEKSGNQEKIPYLVLSEYTGDNIISAGNTNWKLYRPLMQESIQFPDYSSVGANTEKLIELIHSRLSDNGVSVTDLLQRYTISNIADGILGVDLQAMDSKDPKICQTLTFIKRQIFAPLYMSFPVLDKLPIPSRVKAREHIRAFKHDFRKRIQDSNNSRLCPRLLIAYENGLITKQQFEDNCVISLVAGHENPQLLLLSLLFMLAKHPTHQEKIFAQLNENTSPALLSFLYETIRMYPPIGQIMNRVTRRSAKLGEFTIPEGVYIGYNNFATQRDPAFWSDPDKFDPQRWGSDEVTINSNFNKAKSNCSLPAFHGRARACLGEKFALYEAKLFVREIVRAFKLELDPNWKELLTQAGPITPRNLRLIITARAG